MDTCIGVCKCGPIDGRNYELTWQSKAVQVCLRSDVGKKRQHNEDSCLICAPAEPDVIAQFGYLVAVADGMGGASAGEYASRMALQVMSKTYYATAPKPTPAALREAVETANAQIFEESESNPIYSGMGTTLSSIVLRDDWCYIAQVGDSRVYLVRENMGIHQLTHDHSLVAEQVRNGLISEEEARSHNLRNLITRAVGIKETVKVDCFALHLELGDTLLICSDGLSNMVPNEAIQGVLENGELIPATDRLIELALDGGGTDNITALTVRIVDELPETQRQPGAEEINISGPSLLHRLKRLIFR